MGTKYDGNDYKLPERAKMIRSVYLIVFLLALFLSFGECESKPKGQPKKTASKELSCGAFRLGMSLRDFQTASKGLNVSEDLPNPMYQSFLKRFDINDKIPLSSTGLNWSPKFKFYKDNGSYKLFEIIGDMPSSANHALPGLSKVYGKPTEKSGLQYRWKRTGSLLRLMIDINDQSIASFTDDKLGNLCGDKMAQAIDAAH